MKYNDYELLDLIYDNDEVAYSIMLNKYKPLIYTVAGKYYKYISYKNYTDVSFDDFVNEGFLAFDRALKNFDQDKGYLFYSYLLSCLNSCYIMMLRSLFALKNRPVLHFEDLDYEINDVSQVDPYDDINTLCFSDTLKDYLVNIEFIDSAILQLRLNNFKYREISQLLEVNSTRINRVMNKAKKYLNGIDNYIFN